MRVTLVTGEYPPMRGGVADYTELLARGLATMGVEVSVLTSARVKIASANATAFPVAAIVPGWGVEFWRHFEANLRDFPPDIVQIEYQTGAFDMQLGVNLVPWLGRLHRNRPKVVVTFHDLKEPYLLPKIGPARQLATVALASGADAVVVTNHEDFQRMTLAGRPDRTRPLWGGRPLAAIPIGSNIPPTGRDFDRAAWRFDLGFDERTLVVGYFGFLAPGKGLEVLAEAAGLLADQAPIFRLFMIGADAGDSGKPEDVYARSVKDRLGSAALRNRVSWTGFAPATEIGRHLSACDLIVLPFRDGGSLRHGTLAAAIMQGQAIVTTGASVRRAAPGLPRLRNGENAVLVSPGNAAELAGAILRLGADQASRETLHEGARRIAASIAWETIAIDHLNLYRRLTGDFRD